MKKLFFTLLLSFIASTTLVGCFSLSSDIWYAATDDDLSTIKDLLDSGTDIDVQDHDGETPLSSAVSFGHLKSVKFLLSKGANPNIPNKSGDTPILSVGFISDSIEDDLEIIRLLAKSGADMNFQDSSGDTALHIAMLYGKLKFVKVLLDNGAKTDIKNKNNETPILNICMIDQEDIAIKIFDLLLSKGANINAADNDGNRLFTDETCLEKPKLMKHMKSKGLK